MHSSEYRARRVPPNKTAFMQDGSFLQVTVATACPQVGGNEKGQTREGSVSEGSEGIHMRGGGECGGGSG